MPVTAPAFRSPVVPGKISDAQKQLLTKTLQSHVFTDDERESITSSMDWYTVDEAKANIDWVLQQLPIRKEKERTDAAAELWQVVTLNRASLTDGYYEHLKKHNVTNFNRAFFVTIN